MISYSPLRYPGGKSCLYPLVSKLINNLNIHGTYMEPFSGGAGVALSLLLEEKVENIIINDYDKAIYSFWRAVLTDSDSLIRRIEKTPVTIDEWHKQKEIYQLSTNYSIDYAFATFFLNRTNHSGILGGGPIGGIKQNGEWTIAARYYRDTMIDRISRIAQNKKKIKLYNKDIRRFLALIYPPYRESAFVYFDPPYVNNAKRLYKNSLSIADHKAIGKLISLQVRTPWLISYDDVPIIHEIYESFPRQKYKIKYSVARKTTAEEILIMHEDTYNAYQVLRL